MARRLQKELAELRKNKLEWCDLQPADDDIMRWTAMLVGPDDTPYNGGCFNLEIEFPAEYPFKAPKMLQEPHADNPLEADIARQLAENKEAFTQTAKKWTLDFASP